MAQQHVELKKLTESNFFQESHSTFSTKIETSTDNLKIVKFQHIFQGGSPKQTNLTSNAMPAKRQSPKLSESSSSEFQFVNISEPADMKDSKNMKLVRRSVAFSHRRKQVLRHSIDPGTGKGHHSCLDPSLSSHPPMNYCQICGFSLRKKRTPRSSKSDGWEEDSTDKECLEVGLLGAGRVDPFASFPIASQPYMHVLMDHYLAKYCPTLLPFGKWEGLTSPVVTRFFQLAIQNPVYFHATLCIAATHFNISSSQRTFKAIACHHRGEAIKLLNEMLQEQTSVVSDLVIAAVGSLAHHDILIGDIKALENHRKGIIAMIKMRGGMQKSGIDCLVKCRAFWIDMLSATYTRTRPILPIDDLPLITKPEAKSSSSLAVTGFKPLLETLSNFSPLIQSLHELISLTTDICNLRGMLTSHNQLFSFAARRSWVEWSLSNSENSEIENCVRLAALIYTNIVLRKLPCASAVLQHLTNELKDALYDTNLPADWENTRLLLLWVLFQGGAVATGEETRKWYLVHLVRECRELGVQTWSEVIAILDSFLWARCDLVKQCKPLWCEIAVGLSSIEHIE